MARNQEKANVRYRIGVCVCCRVARPVLLWRCYRVWLTHLAPRWSGLYTWSQAMLNRFWKAKEDEAKAPVAKRPYLSSECSDLPECEKWRGQIIREIGRKVAEIQNGASNRGG